MPTEAESGMELRDLLSDVEFLRRKVSGRIPDRESIALNRLAQVFAENPVVILNELVDLAVRYCGADSSGISLEETSEDGEQRFRWVAIAGSFAQYLYGTTPRFFSPCGTCLSTGRAQLYRVTKPYYDFLGVTADPITDGILIPWVSEKMRGTLWVVSHRSKENFDFDDYKVMNSLAGFVAVAVRHQAQEKLLRSQVMSTTIAARSNEIAHRINNPLQGLTNTLYLAAQGGPDAQSHIEQASKELTALSELVRELLTSSRIH